MIAPTANDKMSNSTSPLVTSMASPMAQMKMKEEASTSPSYEMHIKHEDMTRFAFESYNKQWHTLKNSMIVNDGVTT